MCVCFCVCVCEHAICLPAFDLSQRHTCDTVVRPLDSVTNRGMHAVDTDHIDIVTREQLSCSQRARNSAVYQADKLKQIKLEFVKLNNLSIFSIG